MASPSVLTFDAEGRAVDFEVWVDDLQLFLQCDRTDDLSLFDLTSGASPAPAADADATVRSQWATRDAAARLAVRCHLPTTERAHFSQYKSAHTLYDAVVARYSSPATAALSRLMLPYLFPDLAAFPTIADLITHLRTSDTRYPAALPAEGVLPPPLALCCLCCCGRPCWFQVGRRCVCRAGDATPARARGARALEGLEGAVEVVVEAVEGVGGGGVSGAGGGGDGGSSGGGGGGGGGGGSGGGEGSGGGGGGGGGGRRRRRKRRWWSESRLCAEEWCPWWSAPAAAAEWLRRPDSTQRCFGRLTDAWRRQFPEAIEIPRWGDLAKAGVAIFDLDFDTILAAMYAVADSVEGACYLCVPPDPGIEAAALGAGETAALGASASAAPGASASAASGDGESALSGTMSAQAFHTFTLDSGASRSFFRDCTTLTPLSRPVAVSLADPSKGPVLASFSTVLPCLAAPSGTLSGLYLPSFSTNLVSRADLQDRGVDEFTPASQRVTHGTCARTNRHLATFTRRPGSSLYTITAESAQVAASSQVFAAASKSAPESAPCSCRLLSHQTLLWHQRLGHPTLPCLRGMASRVLVSGLPRSLPPLPLGPGPTCVPCVEGDSAPPLTPLSFLRQRLRCRLYTWTCGGAARVSGQGRERYFLLVVDDYSRYTTVFPCAARGGEFSFARLGAFCQAQGIRKTFKLPASPHQNGIAERCIGMVMDVARTSMMHAAAPHFLWPFAVQYAAHQLNLQPGSPWQRPPALRWTGKVGDASAFRVWGSRTFVRDLSADKLSPRAVPCVFLGFPPPTRLAGGFTTPPRAVFCATQVDPLPPQGPAPSGVSQVDAVEPVEPGGAETGGAEPGGAESGVAEPGGAEPGGAKPGGAEPGGAGSARVATCGASSRREPLSPQELREWFARRWRRVAESGGAAEAAGGAGAARGGAAGGVGAGVSTGVGATRGAAEATSADSPTGVGAGGAGAAGGVGTGGVAGAGISEGTGVGAVGAGGSAGAGAATGDTGAVLADSGGAERPRQYFVPLLEQVLGLPPSPGPAPPLECPQPVQSQSQLQPASPLPAPSPYTGPTGGLAER
ncbi:unnamed protein product, partial [Closterium sp. NIES-64]